MWQFFFHSCLFDPKRLNIPNWIKYLFNPFSKPCPHGWNFEKGWHFGCWVEIVLIPTYTGQDFIWRMTYIKPINFWNRIRFNWKQMRFWKRMGFMYVILQMKSCPVYVGINTISTGLWKFHPFSKFQALGQDFIKGSNIYFIHFCIFKPFGSNRHEWIKNCHV